MNIIDSVHSRLQKPRSSTSSSSKTYCTNTNVMLWCNFEGGSVSDKSSYKTTPTITGATLSAVRPKYGSYSMSFVNSTDNVSFNNTVAIGTGNFTAECWFYGTNVAGRVTTLMNIGTYATGILFRIFTTGVIQLYIAGSQVTYSTAFSANTWYHIAAVRVSGTVTLYVNGTSMGTGSQAGSIAGSAIMIGCPAHGSSNEQVIGYLDNVRISKEALYTTNFTPADLVIT